MADIKQAAKWMQEGKKVRRPELTKTLPRFQPVDTIYTNSSGVIRTAEHSGDVVLALESLLADDWEIAE